MGPSVRKIYSTAYTGYAGRCFWRWVFLSWPTILYLKKNNGHSYTNSISVFVFRHITLLLRPDRVWKYRNTTYLPECKTSERIKAMVADIWTGSDCWQKDLFPSRLSGGQQRRLVGIARALIAPAINTGRWAYRKSQFKQGRRDHAII